MSHARPLLPKQKSSSPSAWSTGPRAWGARFALLLASVSALATSRPMSRDVQAEEYFGAPFSLSTQTAKATQRVLIRATASKPLSRSAEGEAALHVVARWAPSDPSSPERPWFRVSLHEDTPFPPMGDPVVLGNPGEPVVLEAGTSLFGECLVDGACEWPLAVDFEVQGNVAPGVVEVEWSVTAQAHVVDTDDLPKAFAVEISEP
ncbi:hypothetical protein LY474_19125 [Myxococcus stipitatus]|uniref:hypothetical protein n=1 Tax=Myxococcus stipitatus TaxID=83455 RepID=UPI001F1E5E13|nr:hypothetical protein [Myxococcus stipitatus]MCE9669914.1 hypothetical protein [Myxococcus stipitatus]